MLSFRLVYSDAYDLNFGTHVFPSIKYKLIRQYLLARGIAEAADFVEPEPATDEDLQLVHTPEWLKKLKGGTLSYYELLKLEVPYSRHMVQAFWLAAGGTMLAARLGLEQGVGFNIGGGFHHAFPNHGEGFCAIHDVAVAVRKLQQHGAIQRAMVVDCDVHHGNGTAGIFANDPTVFTLSIHQFDNYPQVKPPSTVDVHLADGVEDADYLSKLREPFEMGLQKFQPQVLMYIAGADPYRHDQLGGLSLTIEGLMARDRIVIGAALRQGVPVVVTLAGGYAHNVEDTVRIHVNTVLTARDELAANPQP